MINSREDPYGLPHSKGQRDELCQGPSLGAEHLHCCGLEVCTGAQTLPVLELYEYSILLFASPPYPPPPPTQFASLLYLSEW